MDHNNIIHHNNQWRSIDHTIPAISGIGGVGAATNGSSPLADVRFWHLTSSSISAACCLILIASYIMYPVLRKHPSSLILWRAVCDLAFSAQFIVFQVVNPDGDPGVSCGISAWVIEFAGLGSLGWFFVYSINFYLSVSNPFTRPESRVLRYHLVVWGLALAGAWPSSQYARYRDKLGMCWTPHQNGVNPLNWLLFFGWLFFFWLFSFGVLIASACKLGRGKQRRHALETLDKRLASLQQSAIFVVVFTLFWLLVGVFYVLIYIKEDLGGTNIGDDVYALFAGSLTSLGTVDFICWVITQRHSWRQRSQRHHSLADLRAYVQPPLDDISDVLRSDFVRYTIQGILQSLDECARMERDESRASIGNRSESSRIKRQESHSLLLHERATDGIFPFIEYQPKVFSHLRRHVFKLSDELYRHAIGGDDTNIDAITKHFSEGASGSFFYFSPDKRFLVKTITPSEHSFLMNIIHHYARYMEDESREGEHKPTRAPLPSSLIIRYYGCYSITMYGNQQYFCVMENVLWTKDMVKINERYDLKGSWINRHGKFGSVLKDNDMRKPISLPSAHARTYLLQLIRDAFFMKSFNIMDYSILLGVHHCKIRNSATGVHCEGFKSELEAIVPKTFREAGHHLGTISEHGSDEHNEGDVKRPNSSSIYTPPAQVVVATTSTPSTAITHTDTVASGVTDASLSLSSSSSSTSSASLLVQSVDAARPTSAISISINSSSPSYQSDMVVVATGGISSGDIHMHPVVTSSSSSSQPISSSLSSSSISSRTNSIVDTSVPSFHKQYYEGMCSAVIEGDGIYYMGIIDTLQQWTLKKRLELWSKTYLRLLNPFGVSAQPPHAYAVRFALMARQWLNVPLSSLIGETNIDVRITAHELVSVRRPDSDDITTDSNSSASHGYMMDARRASYLVEATISSRDHAAIFNEPLTLENWETHNTIVTSSPTGKRLLDDYYASNHVGRGFGASAGAPLLPRRPTLVKRMTSPYFTTQ